jgi:precorrin-8X/cobalt-precorrin-8 methylmutase
MTLFDRYIAVDWSAANTPRTDTDSIWIADLGPEGMHPSVNPPTRAEAMAVVEARLDDARTRGQRVLAGFDFAFGYPTGTARAMAGKAGWMALWTVISEAVVDGPDNRSNRFEAAARFNRTLEQEHFWGHPPHRVYAGLAPTRPTHGYPYIAEHRLAERHINGPQPVWKLSGAGSVGGQSLLGIARLARLRTERPDVAVWPFDTDFDRALKPVTLAEIYPSMFRLTGRVLPRDREQVEVTVQTFAALDAAGRLGTFLGAPADLSPDQRRAAVEEEGWIVGAGHAALLDGLRLARAPYERDPESVYARSFATIEEEADLAAFGGAMRDVAIRMIHACGDIGIAAHIRASEGAAERVARALAAKAPILCDCEAVRSSIATRSLRGNPVVVTLNDPRVPGMATTQQTTRSAAAVDLWGDQLAGAVVVIGNAPTALFRLLELLDAGAPKPAAIIGCPVGFVGAAEAKAELALGDHGVPFITLLGRQGGSAIAAAALNAIAGRVSP